ncbi:MAG: hypothetical protein AAB487_00970 [Patescibacteria group bacterium]
MKIFSIIIRSFLYGLLAVFLMLLFYFSLISLISGWGFAQSQFREFWYFVIALSVGFGIQIGLYTYLKNSIHKVSGKVVAVSGGTSTFAMVSCCAHYLANVLPVLGVTGVLTVIGQYQTQLFWVGIVSNLLGITYVTSKVIKYKKYAKS